MSHLIQGLHMPLTLPVMRRLWTGRKQAAAREGRAEKGKGRGREAPSPLWGRAARPYSLRPPFPPTPPILQAESTGGYHGPPIPGANSLVLQKQSIQTSIQY